jgi:hypothetical protein
MTVIPLRNPFARFGHARPAPEGGALVGAVLRRAPRDPLERFVAGYLMAHAPVARDELVAAIAAWMAQRERSAGGGANDLVAWGDGLWHGEARRALARLDGDLIESAGC